MEPLEVTDITKRLTTPEGKSSLNEAQSQPQRGYDVDHQSSLTKASLVEAAAQSDEDANEARNRFLSKPITTVTKKLFVDQGYKRQCFTDLREGAQQQEGDKQYNLQSSQPSKLERNSGEDERSTSSETKETKGKIDITADDMEYIKEVYEAIKSDSARSVQQNRTQESLNEVLSHDNTSGAQPTRLVRTSGGTLAIETIGRKPIARNAIEDLMGLSSK